MFADARLRVPVHALGGESESQSRCGVDKLRPAVILPADPITQDRLACDVFLMADQLRSLVRSCLRMAH